MSLWGQYQQLKEFATLRRALNPYYSLRPSEQKTRWHIWFDGKNVASFVVNGFGAKSKWSIGPELTIQDFSAGDGVISGLASVLGLHHGGVGVIFHIADCTVLNYNKEAYDAPDKQSLVVPLSIENPSSVILGDPQAGPDSHRWRPMLIPGAKRNKFALFRLSSRDLSSAEKLSKMDGAYSVEVRAAPMEALVAGQSISGVLGGTGARILVFYYRRSTMLGVYSQQGVLSEIRLLPQTEGQAPQTLKNDMSLIMQKCGGKELLITVFQCADGAELVVDEIGKIKATSGLDVSLQMFERGVFGDFCSSADLPLTAGNMPLELAVEYPDWILKNSISDKKDTMAMLEMSQADFLQQSAESVISIPQPTDLKVFILLKILKVLSIIGIIAGLLWGSFAAFRMVRSDEWKVDFDEAAAQEARVNELKVEKSRIKKIRLLQVPAPDSKFVMEAVMGLFPSPVEVRLNTMRFSYNNTQDMDKPTILEISFDGRATARGVAELNRLRNPEVVSEIFESVGRDQGLDLREALAESPPRLTFSERITTGTKQDGDFTYSFTGNLEFSYRKPTEEDIK